MWAWTYPHVAAANLKKSIIVKGVIQDQKNMAALSKISARPVHMLYVVIKLCPVLFALQYQPWWTGMVQFL